MAETNDIEQKESREQHEACHIASQSATNPPNVPSVLNSKLLGCCCFLQSLYPLAREGEETTHYNKREDSE